MAKQMRVGVKAAWIAAGAAIITTLIVVFFPRPNNSKTFSPNNNIVQDSGSIRIEKSQNQYNNNVTGDNNTITNGDKTEIHLDSNKNK